MFFIGVNATFFPMHMLGLSGLPRRVPDYPDAFTPLNTFSSLGSMVSLVSLVLFFLMLYYSLANIVTRDYLVPFHFNYFVPALPLVPFVAFDAFTPQQMTRHIGGL